MFTRRMLRIKAMQGLYAFYVKQKAMLAENPNLKNFHGENFSKDIRSLQTTHIQLLQMLLFWADMDEEENNEAHIPAKSHLNQNTWFSQLRNNAFFQTLVHRYHTEPLDKGTLQVCYYEHISQNKSVKNYKNEERHDDMKKDTALVERLCKVAFDNDSIQSLIERNFMEWEIYKELFKSLLFAFIRHFPRKNEEAFQMLHADNIFAKERNFYQKLVGLVLEKDCNIEQLLAEKIHHWSIDRAFLLDCILIKMGLAEGLLSTPKSVIINEYVEMAKTYSTPQSHQFIHGVLDQLIDAP